MATSSAATSKPKTTTVSAPTSTVVRRRLRAIPPTIMPRPPQASPRGTRANGAAASPIVERPSSPPSSLVMTRPVDAAAARASTPPTKPGTRASRVRELGAALVERSAAARTAYVATARGAHEKKATCSAPARLIGAAACGPANQRARVGRSRSARPSSSQPVDSAESAAPSPSTATNAARTRTG